MATPGNTQFVVVAGKLFCVICLSIIVNRVGCMLFCKKYYFSLLFVLIADLCFAQTQKVETLSAQLRAAVTAGQKLNAILALCQEQQSLNRDTLYNLALAAKQMAADRPDKDQKGLAAMALSDAYMRWGWKDSALAAIEPALANVKGYSPAIYTKMLRNQAMLYAARNDIEKALGILFPALTGAESQKDTLNMAIITNSIGSIKMAGGKPEEALVWILRAAGLCNGSPSRKAALAAIYTNAGNAYMQKELLDSALYFIEKAIPLGRETENLFVLATALRINASALTEKKRFTEAESALKEMLGIRKKMNGNFLYVEDNLQLADFYANSGQLNKAIAYCKQLLHTGNMYDTAKAYNGSFTNDPKLQLEYWEALAGYYKQGNLMPEYQDALEKIVVLKDSFYVANSAKAIAEAETQYGVQKKENTILQQKYSLQRSNFLLYGSLAVLAMALLTAFFILRDYRRKQHIKMELAMADERAKATVAIKMAEEKERVRIAADLHDNIGAYATAIKADVEKMTVGSPAMNVPHLLNLQQHSQEIINSLRDTIWVLNKESITITGISDRIKNYINKLQASYEKVQFNITEAIASDKQVNSQAALNIFRIVQEAVHNAIKHSGAVLINIIIESAATTSIRIVDNGNGMDLDRQGGKGNGLVNMQARAAESGLQLAVTSALQKGTTVAIRLPTIN